MSDQMFAAGLIVFAIFGLTLILAPFVIALRRSIEQRRGNLYFSIAQVSDSGRISDPISGPLGGEDDKAKIARLNKQCDEFATQIANWQKQYRAIANIIRPESPGSITHLADAIEAWRRETLATAALIAHPSIDLRSRAARAMLDRMSINNPGFDLAEPDSDITALATYHGSHLHTVITIDEIALAAANDICGAMDKINPLWQFKAKAQCRIIEAIKEAMKPGVRI